jgi:hypothetical protein
VAFERRRSYGFDSASLDEALSIHGLQRPGEIRFLPPIEFHQARKRFAAGFGDNPKHGALAVGLGSPAGGVYSPRAIAKTVHIRCLWS